MDLGATVCTARFHRNETLAVPKLAVNIEREYSEIADRGIAGTDLRPVDRETRGAFGCLAALDAVKGVGPAMLKKLDSLVTFSGAPRPACGQR